MAADFTALFEQVQAREDYLQREWVKKAEHIWETYAGDKADQTPYNVLYSNTEIIVPAVFGQAPIPLIKRRFDNQEGDIVAKAGERMVSYAMDTNLDGYPCYVDAVEAAVMDAALPGAGAVRLRVESGKAFIDYVHWDRLIWAYARRWEDVPWIGFRLDMTWEDIVSKFELSAEQQKTFPKPSSDQGQTDKERKEATLAVYEVWDKRSKTCRFLCASYPGKLLKELPDPLDLSGFFPMPRPLTFVTVTGDLLPRPLYNLYKEQAEELNRITGRIRRITEAIRVRGLYNGAIPEMAQIFSSDTENALIPASTPSVMTQDGSLDKAIWLVPVDKLVLTLRELYDAREQVKGAIYEILGIGDILRGVSKASETLGAQQIKDKWGSLRVNKARARVSRFVRDTARLLLEASAKHTPEDAWAAATGLKLPSSVEVTVLQQAGQPVPPDNWGRVLTVLKDDMQRSYTIDIETNSTVDSEATQDKQDVTEFMTAMGQALTGLGPLAQQGPQGFEAAKAILIEFCKKFRLGPDIQRILEQLPPPPQGVSPELQKAQEDLQKRAQEVEKAEQALMQKQQATQQQVQQATQQTDQMTQQMRKLQEQLTTMKQELDHRANELSMREEALQLATREAKLSIGEAALEAHRKFLAQQPRPDSGEDA